MKKSKTEESVEVLEVDEKKPSKVKKGELEKLVQEKLELNEKCLRLAAEMQNIIRRTDEEKHAIRKYDGEEFIKSIISIVDDFERAINMDDDNLDDEVSRFLAGFKLIYANLINILTSFDVKEIDCKGKQFNPNSMNAVMTESIVEEEVNIVLDVLQKGYMYKDKVIRPAMVKVNQ